MTVHADIVELVWLAVVVPGLVLAVDALRSAQIDRAVVRRAVLRDGESRVLSLEGALAAGDVVGAWWVVVTEALFLLAGVIAVLQPPSSAGGRTVTAWVLIGLLIGGAAAFPVRLYGQRRRRRRLLRAR